MKKRTLFKSLFLLPAVLLCSCYPGRLIGLTVEEMKDFLSKEIDSSSIVIDSTRAKASDALGINSGNEFSPAFFTNSSSVSSQPIVKRQNTLEAWDTDTPIFTAGDSFFLAAPLFIDYVNLQYTRYSSEENKNANMGTTAGALTVVFACLRSNDSIVPLEVVKNDIGGLTFRVRNSNHQVGIYYGSQSDASLLVIPSRWDIDLIYDYRGLLITEDIRQTVPETGRRIFRYWVTYTYVNTI